MVKILKRIWGRGQVLCQRHLLGNLLFGRNPERSDKHVFIKDNRYYLQCMFTKPPSEGSPDPKSEEILRSLLFQNKSQHSNSAGSKM
jgi:hypothetical protein